TGGSQIRPGLRTPRPSGAGTAREGGPCTSTTPAAIRAPRRTAGRGAPPGAGSAAGTPHTARSRAPSSRRSVAAGRGRRGGRTARLERMQAVKSLLTGLRSSADEDLVSGLEPEPGRRPGRKLDHARRAPCEPDNPPPRGQLRVDLLHSQLAVQKDGVDGEAHEDHRDAAALARIDP